MLDSVIKQYANTNMVLDFEGSSIPSIESFYKSFGSDLEYYYNYKSNVFKNIFVSNKIKKVNLLFNSYKFFILFWNLFVKNYFR